MEKIEGARFTATIKEGWRTQPLDDDRILFIHPDHQPRIVELQSIAEGDILPRDTDMVVGMQPGIDGY